MRPWLPLAALLVALVGCNPRPGTVDAGSGAASPPLAKIDDAVTAVASGDKPEAMPAGAVESLNGSFDPARDPVRDLQAAIAAAHHDDKRIILDVGGEWCAWCKRMDAFVEADEGVRDYRDARFVWMKVNYSEENENAAFLSRFPKVKGYPHLFVLDAEGKLLHSQFTGVLEQGKSYDPEKFLAFLQQWAPASSDS